MGRLYHHGTKSPCKGYDQIAVHAKARLFVFDRQPGFFLCGLAYGLLREILRARSPLRRLPLRTLRFASFRLSAFACGCYVLRALCVAVTSLASAMCCGCFARGHYVLRAFACGCFVRKRFRKHIPRLSSFLGGELYA